MSGSTITVCPLCRTQQYSDNFRKHWIGCNGRRITNQQRQAQWKQYQYKNRYMASSRNQKRRDQREQRELSQSQMVLYNRGRTRSGNRNQLANRNQNQQYTDEQKKEMLERLKNTMRSQYNQGDSFFSRMMQRMGIQGGGDQNSGSRESTMYWNPEQKAFKTINIPTQQQQFGHGNWGRTAPRVGRYNRRQLQLTNTPNQASSRTRTPSIPRQQVRRTLLDERQRFSNLLNGKTVVIVGPSETVKGCGLGDFIEQFDLVVRLNKTFNISPRMAKDIGRRIDILYNNLNTSDFPGENDLSQAIIDQQRIKFICSPYPPVDPFRRDIAKFIKNNPEVPFHHMDTQYYIKICSVMNTRPYTGLCAIMDLLRFPISRLHIMGIDFYQYGYYTEYRRASNRQIKNLRSNDIHKSGPQLELLKHTVLNDRRITTDKFLDMILFRDYSRILKAIRELKINVVSNNALYERLIGAREIYVVGSRPVRSFPHGPPAADDEGQVVVRFNYQTYPNMRTDVLVNNKGLSATHVAMNTEFGFLLHTVGEGDPDLFISKFGLTKETLAVFNPKYVVKVRELLAPMKMAQLSIEMFMILYLVGRYNQTVYLAGVVESLQVHERTFANYLAHRGRVKILPS